MDPITLMMFALIAVMIFFMFRNSKKRQRAQQELQNNMQPGAEVMLQSGIFATLEEIDEETNRAIVRSGTTTLVVHRNAISQVVSSIDAAADEPAAGSLAPDDDPEFGEHLANRETTTETPATESNDDVSGESNEQPGDEPTPKA